jgi:para-nitrobenzyl esterase
LNTRRGVTTATPQDEAVAQLMNTYWANFAKTGNPNGKGLPEWSAYDAQKNELIEFQSDGTAVSKSDPKKERLDVIEKAVTSGNLH